MAAGADVNARTEDEPNDEDGSDEYHFTPLIAAIDNNRLDLVQALVALSERMRGGGCTGEQDLRQGFALRHGRV